MTASIEKAKGIRDLEGSGPSARIRATLTGYRCDLSRIRRLYILPRVYTHEAKDMGETDMGETETVMTYESVGSVRGGCGHAHKTPEAAGRCTRRDQHGIARAYPSTFPTKAYSDRVVQRSDGAVMVETEDGDWLTEDEDRRRYEQDLGRR